HDPEHVRKKPYQMAKVIRKEITSRSTNVTPSILAIEFLNNTKISSTISSTPANQAIQNALKYDKKLHHPSALEFEK
ncbi:11732_t:CDS:2, partial [Gigaspora rosea]